MTDYMVRAIAAGEQIRAFAVTGRELVEYARSAHNTSPIATAALGRTMCAGLMMADMLKGKDDVLTIQVNGDGPLQGITVTADNHGTVKGYVKNPAVILPPKENGHLNVGGAVGEAALKPLVFEHIPQFGIFIKIKVTLHIPKCVCRFLVFIFIHL